MNRFLESIVLAAVLTSLVSACSKQQNYPSSLVGAPPAGETKEKEKEVVQQLENAVREHDLYRYPEITLLISVADASSAATKVKDAGGKVVYDPNAGLGTDIGFLVVTLPPERLNDKAFLSSLGLRAANVDHPSVRRIRVAANEVSAAPSEDRFENSVYIPVEDVQIPALRARKPGSGLGAGAVVAVIDTGVDASHPVFQDRVVYWKDLTREADVALQAATLSNGKLQVDNRSMDVPATLKADAPLFVAEISEKALAAQQTDADKVSGALGLDINRNNRRDDKFLVVVGSDAAGELAAVVDTSGNGELEALEVHATVLDYNRARQLGRSQQALVSFPARTRIIAYPLLISTDASGVPSTVTLGMDLEDHGTHVAGIIAGNGEHIVGAAPQAKIMALKVCSGITCTESAILRALVETVSNSSGLVPDVVNISLGSHEAYQQDVFNLLMRDLAAKYGITFFISASNSGPGFRTINSIGSFGPVVSVGAHVSRKSLQHHYQLQPDVAVPENNLLFFTSLGPSYTGQQRPNIVAPGSALSSVPFGGSAMFNGTSMSSPLATGAAAALISLAKESPQYEAVAALKTRKLEELKQGVKSGGTLIGLPLALRSALENTALRLGDYTMAHQGHGLIDVNAAYDAYLVSLEQLANGNARYFDLQINGNNGQNRLYDRSENIAGVKRVLLSLEQDGEETAENVLSINNLPSTVRLEKVEVQSGDASVQVLISGPLPFHIGTPGNDATEAREYMVVMNSARHNYFDSVRHLDRMEAGKTYVAHYNVFQRGVRVFTLLDVVHKPLVLPDQKTALSLPGISTSLIDKVATLGRASVDSKPMALHRYPVVVGSRDSRLQVTLALAPGQSGSLYLQVFTPDGKEAVFDSLLATPSQPSPKRLVKVDVPTSGKTGIYEVVVSNANGGRFLGPTRYDLLVTAVRVKAATDSILLKAGSELLVPVVSSNLQIKKVQPEIVDLQRVDVLENVPVVANRWTYQKVNVEGVTGATDLVVAFGDFEGAEGYFGRVDHNLYQLEADGKSFSSVTRASADGSSDGVKVFEAVELDPLKPVYAALETFATVPEAKGLKNVVSAVTLEVTALRDDLGLVPPTASLVESDSTDVFLVRLSLPSTPSVSSWGSRKADTEGAGKVNAKAVLVLRTDDPTISAEIPVYLAK